MVDAADEPQSGPVRPPPPRRRHLALFVAAYIAAAGFAQLLAIVPDTGISIWPPSGIFLATLIFEPMRRWPWWLAAGLLAELIANLLWFQNPIHVAVLLNAGNALEAMAGAWLVRRACPVTFRLNSLREVLALVALGGVVAPVASATVGSATLAWADIQSFASAWPLWWIGDATGAMIFAPLTLIALRSWPNRFRLSPSQWLEVGALSVLFLAIGAISLSQYLPFAYLVMPPLVWMAVRFEFKGAVITLALLALLIAILTALGASHFVGDAETQKQKQVMLQLFLGISAFTALVVAAVSRQHHDAADRLRLVNDELERRVAAQTASLIDREARLRLALSAGRAGTWDQEIATRRTVLSDGFYALLGAEQPPEGVVTPEFWADIIVPEDLQALRAERARAEQARDMFVIECRMRRQDNGEIVHIHGTGHYTYDAEGRATRFSGVVFDVSELKRHQQRQQMLINELSHRVKNTLATVQSIAMQSLRGRSGSEATADFIERLAALARGHDILAAENWEGAYLSEIVNRAVSAYAGTGRVRVTTSAGDVWIPPRQALAMTLALHELCTNAAKYGALSNDTGHVDIDCALLAGGTQFRLTWREHGGPPVEPPTRQGFGSRLLERGLKHDLHGDIAIEFRPEGVVCRIEAPVPGAEAPATLDLREEA